MSVISVLMPVYNAEEFLSEAIHSILNQTFTDFELLICDDASKDGSYAALQAFNDPRIRLFQNEKNLGYLKTCNFLASQAQGEFITFQDADDYSRADRFALQMALIQSQNLDFVGSHAQLVKSADEVVRTLVYPLNDAQIKDWLAHKTTPPFCGAAIIFKRQLYEDIGLYDERFDRLGAEDYDWIYRAADQTKMGNVDEPLYAYRLNPESVSKVDTITNPLSLYSEDLAKDLYRFRRDHPAMSDVEFFEERRAQYLGAFEVDKSRLFSKTVYKLAIAGHRLTLIRQFFIILAAKGAFKYKKSALFMALVFIGLGYGGAQHLKALLSSKG